MKEYKVITGYAPKFAQVVIQELKHGWQLVGGVSVTAVLKEAGVYEMIYSQALAK